MMRSQLSRLAGTTLTYGVGQVLNRSISFFLLPLFTSYLTPADYGVTSILGLVLFLTFPVFSLGLSVSMGVCYFEGDSAKRKEDTIWTALGILGVSTLLLATIGLLLAPEMSSLLFHTKDYDYFIRLSLLTSCFSILTQPPMLYLQYESRARVFVALTSISTLVTVSLSVLMVVVLRKGVQGLLEGGLIAQTIILPFYLIPVLRHLKPGFNRLVGIELVRLGLPLIPSVVFLFILQQANRYILQWYGGLALVGIYTIGFNFGMLMNLIVSAFTTAWHPFFLSFIERQDEARILFGRIMTYYVLGWGAVSILFFIAAKPVVFIMTQSAFHDAYLVVGLSATAQFLIGIFSILLAGMYFAKEVKYQFVVQAGAAAICLLLNFVLIPLAGLLGAAVALAGGYLAMVVLQQIWNLRRRYLPVQYEWAKIKWFGLLYMVYVILLLWRPDFPPVVEISISLGAGALLPLPLYLLLSQHERRLLKNMMQRLKPGYSSEGSA